MTAETTPVTVGDNIESDDRVRIAIGDCREVMRVMEPNSIDSIVCDPPYGLSFMGKGWDHSVPGPDFWEQALRVAKPGAHLVAFGGTRTYHRLACAIEDAGWELRDSLIWMYGSGFPKSHDVSKGIGSRKDWAALRELQGAVKSAREALGISQSEAARRMGLIPADERLGGGGYMWFETGMTVPTREQWPALKAALGLDDRFDLAFDAAYREKIGTKKSGIAVPGEGVRHTIRGSSAVEVDITAPATDAAKQWDGWGTALKPGYEPVILARKPFKCSVAENVQRWGTGALNIDATRIGTEGGGTHCSNMDGAGKCRGHNNGVLRPTFHAAEATGDLGRWPANVILDPEAGAALDAQTGDLGTSAGGHRGAGGQNASYSELGADPDKTPLGFGDSGGPSRFFYCSKASRAEREAGLHDFTPAIVNDGRETSIDNAYQRGDTLRRNTHPTVKPVSLMAWLCKLVTPPGGHVLDPFAGSGSTGCAAVQGGFRFTGIELDAAHVAIVRARIAWWDKHGAAAVEAAAREDERAKEAAESKQTEMFPK